ncbi:uncharacterized protein EDB93DRAFT_1183553 [Suillus bovinus]|uniref:uncharacterized protein n=1 Tax=Suillus bovinus TaxID=48563 RepID=UPI001B85CCD8|nr:uncharacterized protein EDB93DRAFT_1183553 [Suillus bovinus]KAG2128945.1 hypothetical protein EDB93DRAFT_1183553 [Suillus bovinus]
MVDDASTSSIMHLYFASSYESTYYLLLAAARWARLLALGRFADKCSSLLSEGSEDCLLSFFACFLALCFLTARINNMIMVE